MRNESIESRLRRIEDKLGITSENMTQEFAQAIEGKLFRLDRAISRLNGSVFGEKDAEMNGMPMAEMAGQTIGPRR